MPDFPALDLPSLRAAYSSGEWTPTDLMGALLDKISQGEPSKIWIHLMSAEEVDAYASALEGKDPAEFPLYGVPFAIKDNIDLAGLPTTAACPDASYKPERTAFVVEQLIAAGAIPIGKTNLDQFATGLVGVRSPYGFPPNSVDADYIPGGSSSGSAIALARGLVSFSLGTDTAGSGRVPASFNNLVGVKPTRGLLSNTGLVPACRSLDCISIFAANCADAEAILRVVATFDPEDSWAREAPSASLPPADTTAFRFGVPSDSDLEFFGNDSARQLFDEAVVRLESLGGQKVIIDFSPFLEAARLLYEGPWVAERYLAIEDILKESPEILHPVTRQIISGGGKPSAADAFRATYRLEELRRKVSPVWQDVDFIVTPTAGTIYTAAEVEADPIQTNSNLGYYTNFMNLLDFAACAVPAGFMTSGLPFGITLFGPAFQDERLLQWAAHFRGESIPSTPIPEDWMRIVVCGAHMEGLALNHQLLSRGGRFVKAGETAPAYQFYALPPTESLPPRPGLIRTAELGGAAIKVEVWALSPEAFGDFVEQIPSPLSIGKVELADGSLVSGFLCEPWALAEAEDITALADWRAFVQRSQLLA